jgi:hypothetical protein
MFFIYGHSKYICRAKAYFPAPYFQRVETQALEQTKPLKQGRMHQTAHYNAIPGNV